MTDGPSHEAGEIWTARVPADPGRRGVLRGVGAVAAAGVVGTVLTACGADEPAAGQAGAGDPAATTPGSDDSAGDSAEAGSGGAGPAGATVSTSEVPEGGAVSREVGGRSVILAQPNAGEFRAFDSRCPHQGCTVAVARALELACPCHASLFDATDGSVTQGPATTGLTELDVSVAGDEITIA